MIKLAKTDKIVAIYGVNDKDILTVTTVDGKFDIPISNIVVGSSVSSGMKILDKNTTVLKADVIRG